jgi:DNA-binding protein H-NS
VTDKLAHHAETLASLAPIASLLIPIRAAGCTARYVDGEQPDSTARRDIFEKESVLIKGVSPLIALGFGPRNRQLIFTRPSTTPHLCSGFGNIATRLRHAFSSSCHLGISRCTIPLPLPAFRESFLEANMKDQDLAMKSADELWALYEKIRAILPKKLDAERHQLERRLMQLAGRIETGRIENESKARRPYPKVHPKYRNPEKPSETWSGRGRQPHWVGAQLRSGKKFDELLIARTH